VREREEMGVRNNFTRLQERERGGSKILGQVIFGSVGGRTESESHLQNSILQTIEHAVAVAVAVVVVVEKVN
jgi:hypothetical protein